LLSQQAKGRVRSIVPRSARNWLRSPRKSLEWLWDSLSFSVGARRELALLPDWRVICHPRVYKVFSFSQLTDPEQSEEFRNFVRYCIPSMCLFDIGASYGAFSLVAAHFGGTAIAVEPSPIATRFIRVECQLNGFEKNIQVVEACAGDVIGEVEMLSSGVFSDGYFRIAPGRSSKELTKTRAVTIDRLAEQFGAPTHIKIDVEGYEAKVLRGARKTIANLSPLLFLELHNEMIRADGGDPARVLDDLAEMKYEELSINGVNADRDRILRMPICRLVVRRLGTS
jgi:FkbM family methyltransferase